MILVFFFNDTATTEIYTLSLHDALPILVDVDPVGLVRERNLGGRFALAHYVNDRPYASSSFLSVALGRLFGTAMTGRSKERQEAADRAIPLEASLPVAACRAGAGLARPL